MTPDNPCAQIRPLLLEYALGQLPTAASEQVEHHLVACAACRAEFAQWRAMGDLLAEIETRVPHDENAMEGWNQLRARLHTGPQVGSQVGSAEARDEDTFEWGSVKRSKQLDLPAPSHREHRNAIGRRTRPLWALFAAAALILLSVGIFSVFGGPNLLGAIGGHHPNATATPAACAPDQYQVRLPAHASIASIAMVSPEEGWAVGNVWDPQGSTPPASLILHLQQCVWSPVGNAIPSTSLFSISVGANGEGWAVGATQKRDPLPLHNDGTGKRNDYQNDQLVVLHITHREWQRTDFLGDQTIVDAKVHMTSTGGWMLLDRGKQTHLVGNSPVSSYDYTLLRYADSTWSEVPLSFRTSSIIISDMSAVSGQEVWLVGYGTKVGDPSAVIARYFDGAWQKWAGNIGDVPNESLYYVAAQSGENVYVAGTNFHYTAGNDYSTVLVLHFDGVKWVAAQLPGDLNNPHGALSQANPTGLTVSPQGSVWVFAPTFMLLHVQGNVWQIASIGSDLRFTAITDLMMATPIRGWAIANVSAQTDIGSVPVGHLVLLDGASWLPVTEHQV